MSLLERHNNIYVIDTKMSDFDHYNSAYLVEGKEIALIDTGQPKQIEAVRTGIKSHGFSISDISYIFITHEHKDHCGNVGPLLRENPKAKVYVNPVGLECLTSPSTAMAWIPSKLQKLGGEMEPVPLSRIIYLNDGDVFDLGNGEILKIIFTPGHQPGGIAILEEKNKGLFINDLVGNYFSDADAHYPLNPPKSDSKEALKSLKKLTGLPLDYLYLGHYGICDKPKQIIARAINNIQQLLDIGIKYMGDGKPEVIASKMYEMIMPELEKIRLVRGERLYQYASQEHIPSQVSEFIKYCREKL